MAQGSPEIAAALLEDLNEEVKAAIQYVWLAVSARGISSLSVADYFEHTAKTEMKHIEMLAQRLDYYGVSLPVGPWGVKTYTDLSQMLRAALALEQAAIKRYQAHAVLAESLKDSAVRLMLEEILRDEQDHAHRWETALT